MSKRLKALQDRSAAIVGEMQELSDKLGQEDRNAFTTDEQAKFEGLKEEATATDRMIGIEQDILARQKKLATVATGDTNPIGTQEADDLKRRQTTSITPYALSGYAPRNWHPLEGETRVQALERAYKSGRWLLSMCSPDEEIRAKNRLWCRENGVYQLAQSENVNSAGGVLVPPVLADQIIILRESYGVFRRFAQRYPMDSDNLTIPRRNTGLTTYYVSDAVAATESQMAWDAVQLIAKELACLVRYPLTLNEDAVVSIADVLSGEIAYQFARSEDLAGFNGDGTSTYGGIRGATVIIDDASHGAGVTTNGSTNGGKQVAAAGGTSYGAMVLGDFEKTIGLLPQYAGRNACWFCSRAAYAAGPQRLMDAGGGNTNETLSNAISDSLTRTDPYGRPYRTFLGYPVIITQVMDATLGTNASVIGYLFGDLALSSAFGDRRDLRIDASPHRYFEFRQIGLIGVQRFDIVNHDLGTTTTSGPLVALQTSAS